MTISHHLNEATLMSCAAGSQPEAMAAVVASHLSVCPHCRKELRHFERIGVALFEDLAPAKVSRPAPVIAMRAASGDAPDDLEPAHSAASAAASDLPAPLRGIVQGTLETLPWRRLAPGVWHYPLPLSDTAEGDLRLLKVAPGTHLPEHGHGGSELTLILKGSYTDRFGTFRAGDVADLSDDVDHQPVADPDQGCICLVASEKKARFKGLFARLLQPLTGL